jgi:tetratricopeptide (TPR) repeat protein
VNGPAGVALVVYETATNTLNRPTELFGRTALVDEIDASLNNGCRVLLHGMGGNGKTAMAATVADRRVEAGKGPYVWLRVGHADQDAIFDAIVGEFATDDEREAISRAVGDRKVLAIRALLAKSDMTLLVVDDAWRGPTLMSVLNATPDTMPALITSRTRFAVSRGTSGLDRAVEVGSLAPADALRLLVNHAGEDRCEPLAEAEALCKDLGYHAFAVEIAGSQLSHYDMSPVELREGIRDAPHEVRMPAGSTAEGRESVKLLLDLSYRALDDRESRVFKAFGAMPCPGATVELLATYLGVETALVLRALRPLTDLSLVKQSGQTRFYAVHDLTFSYAKALARDDLLAIRAVRDFVRECNRRDDHDLLAQDIANVLGGAALAKVREPGSLVSILGDLAIGGFIDKRGHGPAIVGLLDEAIDAARHEPSVRDTLHYLLSKRANAYIDVGDTAQAIGAYREALRLSPGPGRRAVVLAVIGKVLAQSGEADEANDAFAEAIGVAEANQDDAAKLRVYEQHSIAAFDQQDFELVRQITNKGIELSRRIGQPASEATFLNNLGSAEYEIGVRASLQRHQEARAIAARIRDDDLLALANWTLGIDHHALEQFDEARAHLSESLRLYEALGHVKDARKVKALMRRFGYLDPALGEVAL